MKKIAVVVAVALFSIVVAARQSTAPANAATPDDQVTINVTQGSLATNTGLATAPLALSPAFDTATTDYVLWCQSGVNTEQFTLSAASGSLTVTYQGPGGTPVTQSGSAVNVQVALGENQAVEVVTGQASGGSYWVRCLPQDFPRMSVAKSGTPSFQGWYLTSTVSTATNGRTSSDYAMVLDQNGTPVWYQRTPAGAFALNLLNDDQTLAWGPYAWPGGTPFVTYNLSTQATGQLASPLPHVDVHELQQLPNGDYVLITTPLRTGVDLSSLPDPSLRGYSAIVGCVVEIVNPSGGLVWSWDAYSDGHILPDESQDPLFQAYGATPAVDMYHCNSADVSTQGTNVLVSFRETGAIYDVAMDPGNADEKTVRWKLGGNSAVPQGATHLVPTGDPEGTFSGQHDARIRSVDANDQPAQISLYDDHTFPADAGMKAGGARGLIYNINASGGTATFVKQYPGADSQVAAQATGGFSMYSGGTDNVVTWGFRSGGSGFTEFDQNGNVLMTQTFPDGEFNYRTIKVPLSALNINELRATAGLPRPAYPSATTWSKPVPYGVFDSGPALTSWSSTRYDLFGRGPDGQLWHAYWNGSGWSGWEPLGGQIMPGTGPAAVAWAPNRIDIFVEGTDAQLYHMAWTGFGWYGWERLGGTLSSSPAVSSWAPGRLDVVVRGTDDGIWHLWWDGTAWGGFEALGGVSLSAPGIASSAAGLVDITTEGTDGQAYHRGWNGQAWSGWASLGGNLSTGPGMASTGANELDVLAAGQGQIPERLPYQSGWQLWQPLGESPAPSSPIAPQTAYTPALVALGASAEEACLTNGVGNIQCLQLPAGTPPAQQVRPSGGMSPGAIANQ